MQMFTDRKDDGIILYFKYLATFENGDITRAPIESCIGASRDGRYRRVSWIIAIGKRLDVVAEYFKNCGTRYNETAEPGQRITGFTVEIWEWDYFRSPMNPELAVKKNEVEFQLGVMHQNSDVSMFAIPNSESLPL